MNTKFIIGKDILAATTDCQKKFSCLSEKDNGSKLCKVMFCVNCKIHGILCESEMDCSYKLESEERTFCMCPTRKEIYSKYDI